jgi:DNA-binding beta-propeller fold protein YncE
MQLRWPGLTWSPLWGLLFLGLMITGCQDEPDYLSPTEVLADGGRFYVVASSAPKVLVLDEAKSKVLRTYVLGFKPSGLALSNDRNTLYVTGGGPEGYIQSIDLESNRLGSKLKVGHTPMSPVLHPSGNRLFICNRFNDEVMVVDLEEMEIESRIPVQREPVAAVLSGDGGTLYVANHLPTGPATSKQISSAIDMIDTRSGVVTGSIPLPNGSVNLRSLALSPDGSFLLVPSVLARYQVPTTQLARGWVNTHALHLIDTQTKRVRWTVLLDDMSQGAANPWGVLMPPGTNTICVSHAATHEVSIIDAGALIAKLNETPVTTGSASHAKVSAYDHPAQELGFLSGIRQRVKLPGYGPRGLAWTGQHLAVAQFFSDSIALVPLDSREKDIATIPLGPSKEMDAVRAGHLYFEDAGLCFQQWQSCATCHPGARADALNWDLLNDGIGNPKNTKSMIFAHRTPPAMVSGVRGSAEDAVRAGIRHIQFSTIDEAKASAIDAYLKSLLPVPSPYLVDGKFSPEALEGMRLFKEADCLSCHSGPYFTNMEMIDVGTGSGLEQGRAFDVPTLIEIWRTAPYLYDGRAATLEDVLTTYNPDDRHGKTSNMTDDELKALVMYLKSL